MKIKNIIKKNLFGFIIGGIIFGTITTVLATSIAASTLTYTTEYNSNVSDVNAAVVDLYTRANTYINSQPIKSANFEYKYWNDSFGNNHYYTFESPDDVYTTRSALETAYGSSNFANNPIYIRSAFKGDTAIYHEACFYHTTTGKEFCLAPNYWVGDSQDQTDGSTTKAKLKADMEAALGVTMSSCGSDSSGAYCDIGSGNYCRAASGGDVYCCVGISGTHCLVDVGGDTYCMEY